jgi:hypothetical protein
MATLLLAACQVKSDDIVTGDKATGPTADN